jgi:hypothetical protein
MDESLVIEVWDTFKEYIPEKNKDMAATQYVDFLLGKEISPSILESFLGYDTHLDDAIKTAIDEEETYKDEEEDDWGGEEEDY